MVACADSVTCFYSLRCLVFPLVLNVSGLSYHLRLASGYYLGSAQAGAKEKPTATNFQ
jgi:hypothetical protein